MKKALKAALLSGLVFPGVGYFVLRRTARGVIVVVLSAACLVLLIKSAVDQASVIVNKALSGDVPLDVASIERLMNATPVVSNAALLDILGYVLLACWVFSILDGYRIGRIEDARAPGVPAAEPRVAPITRNANSMAGASRREMPAGTILRKARQEDLSALLRLYGHLNPADPAVPVTTIVDAAWQQMLAQPGMQVFVAELAGAVVASVTLLIIPNLTRAVRPYALIENVVTDPAWRRRGIATQLLQLAQTTAWDAGCYKVMLMTGRKDEATLRFYRHAGFSDSDKTAFVARP